MAFLFNKLLILVLLAGFSLLLYFGYLGLKKYQAAIDQNPQRTANIADIVDMKIGTGKYLVEYPSLGGTGYETAEAKALIFDNVFEIGEQVTVSFQPKKTLIIEHKGSFFFASLAIIYGSWWFMLLASLFSVRKNEEEKKTFVKSKLMGSSILIGFAMLMFSVMNYGLKEKGVYLNHSHQVSGELTSYHQKMCGGKNRKKRGGRTKKYPCFTRVVSYSPLGSFESFEVKDDAYSGSKDWDIGTPFEVVYLKSNEASARILDTVESNTWVYVLLFFGVFCLFSSGWLFWSIFNPRTTPPTYQTPFEN